MVKSLPQSKAPITDIHRFWEQTGNFYARGMGNDNITDPFIGLGVMPAGSALFRDMTQIRFQHPEWISQNCTACGKCYTICPDTAIPGLVSEVDQILDTAVKRVRRQGGSTELLPKAVRQLGASFRKLLQQANESDPVMELLEEAIETTIAGSDADKKALTEEFEAFREALDGMDFALTRPYYTLPEKQRPGDGGLLSITVNPTTCKGCMECVEVCEDDALRVVTQTAESVKRLRKGWDFWLDLPTTPAKYSRVENLEEGIGALETILLDKANYLAFTSGDGACLGCSEKTAVHLFTATVEALMQPRVRKHVEKLTSLIADLERRVQLKLVEDLDISDPAKVERLMRSAGKRDMTLAGLAGGLGVGGGQPIDQEWIRRTTQLIARLKDLK